MSISLRECQRFSENRAFSTLCLEIALLMKWLEIIFKTLSLFFQYKERLVKAFTEDALPYFSGGTSPHLQPVVDSIYPLHEIAAAHRMMEENKNIGKIVIKMPASS